MADAAVETPQTAGAAQDTKHTESTNASDSKPTESTTNGASEDVKGGKATNGDKEADDEDQFERYDTDKKERRGDREDYRHKDRRDRGDRDDHKRRDFDDRGRGRGRGRGGGGRGRGGRGGRGGFDNRNNQRNVKTRFERKEESNDATEIRRQIEFYFSDSNLPVDNYLLQEVGGSENRPFPLKTIHQFKRMRHYQPFSAIVEAVKGSYILEVNDKDEVYRKKPLPEHFTLDVVKNNELLTTETMARSIYAKGFGEEEADTAFKIEEFFEPYGVRGVRLRREKDGTFKGSVFVEFEDEAAAQQFLDMEEKPKFNDNELEIKSKKEYVDQKSQDIRDGKVKPNSPSRRFSNHRNDRGNFRDNRDKGSYNKRKRNYDDDEQDNDVDRDDWRERRDRFQKKGRRESRSRSPYRAEKKADDDKPEEKSEEKKADDEKSDEKKADEQKPEEPKVEEAKVETAA
ncbi:hypothetical protein M409DRAFT_28169 [Zasmidium cellare ATCC 36951]|uniref:HTH La-type RNA-binding domain-containing protein n=1 Tax=Zasmidium cellare ATCC 36951 TaxID=1080233 RepID=A0A6A6C6Q7_ZASCE|nr:uncharacterized protein M409DRAFT_28169 [Zasmidium cellare ATCC 36951]KAF2161439.1 hypothetical protein M409DRAFT_28169 [Zasmidium cellare ATCC 36951]